MINSFKACPSKKKGIGVCIKIALILFLAIIIIGFLGINQSSAQTADNDQIIEYEG
ncbi:MAG: hypothetical protein GX091_06205, partial [Peptococcaceae bacterium]|nr:hypothetical protein [Peptococcaceae bacterium]